MPAPWGLELPEFPKRAPKSPLPIADRAITLRQLRELSAFMQRLCKVGLLRYPPSDFNESVGRAGQLMKWSQLSMHEITSEVIKKVIPKNNSCSWVELVGRGRRQTRRYFCSHNWGESFCDFVATIAHHAAENKVRPDETYWICVFANDQWKIELGATLADSPFYEALRGSRKTIVMMDKASEVLRRLWCVFEMHETSKLEHGFEFWTPLGRVGSALVSSGPVLQALQRMDVVTARATNEVDQRQIINHIADRDELSGIIRKEDGGKRLDPERPPPAYEEEIFREHRGKFEDLKSAVLDASVGVLNSKAPRLPLLPTWDAAGKPLDVAAQVQPIRVLDAAERGMALGQLRAFFEVVRRCVDTHRLVSSFPLTCRKGTTQWVDHELVWDPPQGKDLKAQVLTYQVCDHFVLPMTRNARCSYMELVADGPQPCEHYVTHYWGTELKTTMAALEWHAEARRLPDTTVYWMCVFANEQWRRECFTAEQDIRSSPFSRALHIASGAVGILGNQSSERLAELFNRAWCVYEMWATTNSGKSFDLLMESGAVATTQPFCDGGWERGAFSASASRHLLSFRGQESKTSTSAGRRLILNTIARREDTDADPLAEHPAYGRLNRRMHERAAGPALRDAAQRGDVTGMREVMEKCPGLLLSSGALRGSLGEGPVHVAAGAGQLRALRLLLELRASANDQDLAGESPLHYAALAGHAVAIWELYRSGADAGLASFAGETPLDVAWQNPAYFCGVANAATVDALRASAEDGGDVARQEFEARLADEAFMEAFARTAQEQADAARVRGKPAGRDSEARVAVGDVAREPAHSAGAVPVAVERPAPHNNGGRVGRLRGEVAQAAGHELGVGGVLEEAPAVPDVPLPRFGGRGQSGEGGGASPVPQPESCPLP